MYNPNLIGDNYIVGTTTSFIIKRVEPIDVKQHSGFNPAGRLPPVEARRKDNNLTIIGDIIFDALAEQWLEDTRYQSSISYIKQHPSFSRLVKMEGQATKRIIQKIRSGKIYIHWFPLLRALTGVNPVKAENRGFLEKMADDWLNWANTSGIA